MDIPNITLVPFKFEEGKKESKKGGKEERRIGGKGDSGKGGKEKLWLRKDARNTEGKGERKEKRKTQEFISSVVLGGFYISAGHKCLQ